MRTHITLRLSDDVLQAVDEAAERSGRTRAREIEWNLRMMLLPKFRTDVGLGDIGTERMARVVVEAKPSKEAKTETAEITAYRDTVAVAERYKACSHGGNEYTCERVACKIKTGRA